MLAKPGNAQIPAEITTDQVDRGEMLGKAGGRQGTCCQSSPGCGQEQRLDEEHR